MIFTHSLTPLPLVLQVGQVQRQGALVYQRIDGGNLLANQLVPVPWLTLHSARHHAEL